MASERPASASRAWDGLKPALSEWTLDAVSSMGFSKMTPVQASTIPLFMGNKDVVVEAVTGSGKTLAFLIPLVERLLRLDDPIKKHHVGAIIISPTRELATQIHSVLVSLLGFHGPSAAALKAMSTPEEEDDMEIDLPAPFFPSKTLKVVPQLLLGGTTTPAQDLSTFLKHSPNLLIATPGRLLELLTSPHVHCPQSSFEALVLDEADRLLDLGFKDELQKILSRLPKQRRTGLFSASVSEAVDQLIRVGLRNPVRVAVRVRSTTGGAEKRTPNSLQMRYLLTPPDAKLPILASLLKSVSPAPQKSILYLSTCAAVDYFQHILPLLLPGVALIPLHGKHPPAVRNKNFARFAKSVEPTALLTTDVAARGLDIPAVDLVVQIDPPSDPKAFIHRCGRAGRAGRRGLAVLFLQPGREEDYVSFLAVRDTPVSLLEAPVVQVGDAEMSAATETIRTAVLADRALHDKAQRAFVSWVQAYRKHQASSIFRIEGQDWEALGRGWGLLKIPRMPEIKGWEGDRGLGVEVDWENYRYKDKAREAHRVEEAAKRAAGEGVVRKRKEDKGAWSGKREAVKEKEVRRERKRVRREEEAMKTMTVEELAEKRELERMIERVRRETKGIEEEEWNGLDD
ncbi:putative DEAD/DEAH box helicase [Trichodelitschia bisporula]|uniref:ATP-dependent RNA helicase n=1 Tax=Trichodelitschia bisporula TaxID=703511 RepID=A0A6G1I5D9_9PEZI|nr:putative DEAD/DEAH box helicase [Trichodelitschia bisporula]